MNYLNKVKLKEDQAKDAIDNWQTCPLSQLKDACDIFDYAIILLIQRYAQYHR